jgi:sirohydrochlorin ferrochelatase
MEDKIMTNVKSAVVLLGHGSRVQSANEPLATVAGWCMERMPGVRVESAFLQLAEPGLEDVVGRLAAEKIGKLCIVPFFLYPGAHVREDIPELVEKLRADHPTIEITIGEHLGVHPLMADIVAERVGKAS